jgi:hypothetical protein
LIVIRNFDSDFEEYRMVDPSADSKRTSSWLPHSIFGRVALVVSVGLVILLLGVIFFGWLKDFLIFGTFDFAVDKFVDATGMSIFLVKGILVVVLIPFFLALREIGMVPLFKKTGRLSKRTAYGIAACYVSAYFLSMYFATKDTYFHHTGDKVIATKYYAVTPEGIRYFDTPGVDPKYGITLRPATPEMVANEERRKRGNIPKPLIFGSISEVTFFDPLDGQPKVWFSRSSGGALTLFSSSGFDPISEQELAPVTPQIVEEFKRQLQEAESKKQADERQAQEAAKSAAIDNEKARAEAQERDFRNRYVNALARRSSARKGLSPLIIGDSDSAMSIQSSIATALQGKGVDLVEDIFKPEFLRDGLASRLFDGDLMVAKRLRLDENVDSILLVRSSHNFTSAADVSQGLRTSTINLDMKCIDVVNLRACGSRSVTARGAGFSDSDALESSLRNAGTEIQKYVKSLGI